MMYEGREEGISKGIGSNKPKVMSFFHLTLFQWGFVILLNSVVFLFFVHNISFVFSFFVGLVGKLFCFLSSLLSQGLPAPILFLVEKRVWFGNLFTEIWWSGLGECLFILFNFRRRAVGRVFMVSKYVRQSNKNEDFGFNSYSQQCGRGRAY